MAHLTADPVLGPVLDHLTGGNAEVEAAMAAAFSAAVFSSADGQGSADP